MNLRQRHKMSTHNWLYSRLVGYLLGVQELRYPFLPTLNRAELDLMMSMRNMTISQSGEVRYCEWSNGVRQRPTWNGIIWFWGSFVSCSWKGCWIRWVMSIGSMNDRPMLHLLVCVNVHHVISVKSNLACRNTVTIEAGPVEPECHSFPEDLRPFDLRKSRW